ncbi:MAG: sensor histidine kinase, partial [Opitutaceae bacterium]
MDPIKRRVLTGVVSLGALIFIVELLIMELLPDLLPELPAGTFRWLDPIVLILVLLPFLHLLVIRPLLQHSEELLRAKQAERRFLSNMSHEIRTPLNAITGLVGLLEESPLSPEQGGHLQSVRHASEHLLALINDVLDLNRIEQGSLRLEPAFFSLRRLEAEVRQVFTPMFGGRSVRFTVTNRLTADIRILGDQLRIKQVLYNLIGNAAKFTESGSVELEISARPLTGNRIELALAVRDTGPGMSAET